MAKSPEEGMASLHRNLLEKTGKSIDEWAGIARSTGLGKHKDLVAHLKSEHGLSHGYANQIAQRALAADDAPKAEGDEVFQLHYDGAKAGLLPIHDALCSAIRAFGPDVEFLGRKSYLSVRRSKQFAMIQPTTVKRVDVGLILKGVEPLGRLEASGSFNAMFTHRVKVGIPAEVDAELIGWLRRAYDEA